MHIRKQDKDKALSKLPPPIPNRRKDASVTHQRNHKPDTPTHTQHLFFLKINTRQHIKPSPSPKIRSPQYLPYTPSMTTISDLDYPIYSVLSNKQTLHSNTTSRTSHKPILAPIFTHRNPANSINKLMGK